MNASALSSWQFWAVASAVFAALTAASLGGYVSSLDALARFAEKKKELLIETLCR